MHVPLRLLRALRTGTAPGLLVATAVATAVFVATPISLAAIASRFGVGAGTAGIFSATQLGAFVVASWGAGRFLRPGTGLFRGALVMLAAANALSVVTDVFIVFVVIRGVAGLALGLLTWLAWSQVFGDDSRQGDIAVVGPLAGVVVSPLFGVLLDLGDDRAVFAVLAVASLVPLAMPTQFTTQPAPTRGGRTRAVPQAMVLIGGLVLLTLGGSAVFVYSGVIMIDELGISPTIVSFVFSANALASIPSARWRGPRPLAGLWLVLTASCAVALGLVGEPWMAWAALTTWGFAFWAGVPGIYSLLAERSAHPAERAGDAQAAMAAGRAAGPLLGGALVAGWSFAGLGIVGGALMATGGLVCVAVERLPTAE